MLGLICRQFIWNCHRVRKNSLFWIIKKLDLNPETILLKIINFVLVSLLLFCFSPPSLSFGSVFFPCGAERFIFRQMFLASSFYSHIGMRGFLCPSVHLVLSNSSVKMDLPHGFVFHAWLSCENFWIGILHLNCSEKYLPSETWKKWSLYLKKCAPSILLRRSLGRSMDFLPFAAFRSKGNSVYWRFSMIQQKKRYQN